MPRPKGEKSVAVSTPKELYATGEKVPVSVELKGVGEKDEAVTTLVVVKLESNPSAPWVSPNIPDPDGVSIPDNTRIPALGVTPRKARNPASGAAPAPRWSSSASASGSSISS